MSFTIIKSEDDQFPVNIETGIGATRWTLKASKELHLKLGRILELIDSEEKESKLKDHPELF